jgi:hypothetical protein
MKAQQVSLTRWVVALLLACGATVSLAATPELRPFSATYSVTAKGITAGTADVQLQKTAEDRWAYQTRFNAGFLARTVARSRMPPELQRSVFSIEDGRGVPLQYTAEDRNNDKDQSLNFDWARGRVTGIFERKPVDLPTQPGLLDAHTVQVALMYELTAGRTPQRFVLLEKGRTKDNVFTPDGTEKLRTAVGEFQTIRFRISRPDSTKSTVFWCAPELGYLPLKVERRDGKDVDVLMAIRTLTVDPAP